MSTGDWRQFGLLAPFVWCWKSVSTWYREMREAQARAEALLRDSLTEAEYDQLRAKGHLEIASHVHPGRLYHVPANGARVRVFEQGRFCAELCVGPVSPLPAADVVLAHKLMIEGCEEQYLQTARWIQAFVPAYGPFGLMYYDTAHEDSDPPTRPL